MSSSWFLDMLDGNRPASWRIYDQLRTKAARPSVSSFTVGARGQRPKDQSSWHTPTSS